MQISPLIEQARDSGFRLRGWRVLGAEVEEKGFRVRVWGLGFIQGLGSWV